MDQPKIGQLLTQACPCVSLNGQLARATAVSLDSINTSKMLELDPSLADNPAAHNPDDATGPSISDTAGVSNETHRCDDEAEQLQQEFESHAKSMLDTPKSNRDPSWQQQSAKRSAPRWHLKILKTSFRSLK
ncbi:hypothetical protein PCASD_15046 [Puccinia coronata f. sp. avenae]|uniref:Uncharacterized protein n=1 Tax=Puccinia coronata f. sp. avenae TaxID=200324 RepID=A0A2N5UAV5_9BASI|nr:hypothetical protein PCASD_15046 [Puccinia coronata f. sp. avenae]